MARVSTQTVDTIDRASALSWVSVEFLDGLNAAYLEAAGVRGYLEFWRRYSMEASNSRLFGPLCEGAIRIFGPQPSGLVSWVGRAWEVTTRDYGQVGCTKAADHTDVVLKGLPRAGAPAGCQPSPCPQRDRSWGSSS